MKKNLLFLWSLALFTLIGPFGFVSAADFPSVLVNFPVFSSVNDQRTAPIDLSEWGFLKSDLEKKPLDLKTFHPALGPDGIKPTSCFDVAATYRNSGRTGVLVAELQLTYTPFSCNACGTGKSAFVLDWFPSVSKAPDRFIRLSLPVQCQVDYLIRYYPATENPPNPLVHDAIRQGQWPSLTGASYAFYFGKPMAPFRAKTTLVLPASIRNADDMKIQAETLASFFSTSQKSTPKKLKKVP